MTEEIQVPIVDLTDGEEDAEFQKHLLDEAKRREDHPPGEVED